MVVVVPFDGTALSETALDRAVDFADVLEARVVVVSVIPNGNVRYARERGWLDDDEGFDMDTVLRRLANRVAAIAPAAEFEYEVVGRYTQAGAIASKIRSVARAASADLVVIGSDNAGRIVSSVSSVGRTVATDNSYDVLIVRGPANQEGAQ